MDSVVEAVTANDLTLLEPDPNPVADEEDVNAALSFIGTAGASA